MTNLLKKKKKKEKDPEADSTEIVNGKFMAFMAKSMFDNDSDEDNDDDKMSYQENDWDKNIIMRFMIV